MKTNYLKPVVNVLEVVPDFIMIGVSGGNSELKDRGQDPGDGSISPQAPRRPF